MPRKVGKPFKDRYVTIGFHVLRERVATIDAVASNLGYKSKSEWVTAIFEKAFNEEIAKIAERAKEGRKP
jgi:hypothetical protein